MRESAMERPVRAVPATGTSPRGKGRHGSGNDVRMRIECCRRRHDDAARDSSSHDDGRRCRRLERRRLHHHDRRARLDHGWRNRDAGSTGEGRGRPGIRKRCRREGRQGFDAVAHRAGDFHHDRCRRSARTRVIERRGCRRLGCRSWRGGLRDAVVAAAAAARQGQLAPALDRLTDPAAAVVPRAAAVEPAVEAAVVPTERRAAAGSTAAAARSTTGPRTPAGPRPPARTADATSAWWWTVDAASGHAADASGPSAARGPDAGADSDADPGSDACPDTDPGAGADA